MYADISTTFEQKIFSRTVKKKMSIGDGVVLPESATFLPGFNFTGLAFDDAVTVESRIARAANGSGKIEWPRLSSFRYFHSNMLASSEIKNKVKELLSSE